MARANGHYKILFHQLTGHCHLRWIWVNWSPQLWNGWISFLRTMIHRQFGQLFKRFVICTFCRRDSRITHCCYWQMGGHQSVDAVQWQRSTWFFSSKWLRPYQRTPSWSSGQSATTAKSILFNDFLYLFVHFLVFVCSTFFLSHICLSLSPAAHGVVLPALVSEDTIF